MKEFITIAREYRDRHGFSVIPVKPDKKPFISWAEFQKRKPTDDEIEEWCSKYPKAMIGIVTGSISGIVVIDCDTEDGFNAVRNLLPQDFILPTARTPRGGWHLYFDQPENGEEITIGTNLLSGVDFRGNGGFVIAPPSMNDSRMKYEWMEGMSLNEIAPASMPDALYNKLITYKGVTSSTLQNLTNLARSDKMFVEGRRDDDLFRVAFNLAKAGVEEDEIYQVLEILAINCKPPFPLSEMEAKIKSALKRAKKKEGKLSEIVEAWVNLQEGYFDLTTMKQNLQLLTPEDKNNADVIINRMKKSGAVEKYGNKAGVYRRVDKEFERVDFLSASGGEFKISLPLSLNEQAKLYPGNICIVAGSKESGKTAFLLNVAARNLGKKRIVYLNSEMGADEVRNRLLLFEDIPLNQWADQMEVYYLKTTQTPADFIDGTDTIWIIDYLEIAEDFSKISLPISAMHEKLGKGIAFVALQKADGKEIGRGADFSREKARLYLSLDWDRDKRQNKMKIIDCKAWRTNKNPRGLVRYYNLVKGSEILPKTGWIEEFKK